MAGYGNKTDELLGKAGLANIRRGTFLGKSTTLAGLECDDDVELDDHVQGKRGRQSLENTEPKHKKRGIHQDPTLHNDRLVGIPFGVQLDDSSSESSNNDNAITMTTCGKKKNVQFTGLALSCDQRQIMQDRTSSSSSSGSSTSTTVHTSTSGNITNNTVKNYHFNFE